MAIEGARELAAELREIRAARPKPLYLVFGAEPYLVRTAAEAIVEALVRHCGATVERVDASSLTAEAVLESVAALSLFSPAKVSVVRNFAHLLSGGNAERLLAGIDAAAGPGGALVFVASGGGAGEKVDKRLKGYKGLARRGAVIELPRQQPERLAKWLCEKAAAKGKKLAPEAAHLLLERAGTDMETLRAELEKALLYCLDRKRIEVGDIEELVGRSREQAVWDVSEAVSQGEAARAVELIEDLLASGTYPLVILSLLIRQARHLLQARILWERAGRPALRDIRSFRARVAPALEPGAFGGGSDDVTSIHPFAAFKRFEAARRRELPELRALLGRLRRADRDAKSGATAGPRELLEELVLDLCAQGASAPGGSGGEGPRRTGRGAKAGAATW